MCLPPTQVCPQRLDYNLSLPYYIIFCTLWCARLCVRLKGVKQGTCTLWISRFQEKKLTNFDHLSYNVNKANNWWPFSFLILLSVFKIMIHDPNCEGRLCCSHSHSPSISPGLHWIIDDRNKAPIGFTWALGDQLDRSQSLFYFVLWWFSQSSWLG